MPNSAMSKQHPQSLSYNEATARARLCWSLQLYPPVVTSWRPSTMFQVGKFARVGSMLAKDSVRSRMESESGISYTEFTYQLLQGYDFVHLQREHGCRVQVSCTKLWRCTFLTVVCFIYVLTKPLLVLIHDSLGSCVCLSICMSAACCCAHMLWGGKKESSCFSAIVKKTGSPNHNGRLLRRQPGA